MEKEFSRISKVIARSGFSSRRDAERAIEAGRVSINDEVIDTPAINVSESDIIKIDGIEISQSLETKLFIYHKPIGLITSYSDEAGRKTVFDAIGDKYGRLMSIGRLDLNSQGLLLMTNDGEFQRFMERPINGFERVYQVRVHGVPTKADIVKLQKGITVDGVTYGSIDVSVDRILTTNSWLTVKLYEGKNREIRKTLEALGYMVNRLIRVSYAGLELRNLEEGEIYETKIPKNILEQFNTNKIGNEMPIEKNKKNSDTKNKDRVRSSEDRQPRTGDKPRSFGDRPVRSGDRPRSFGDRPARSGDRPRSFGDRPARTGERPARSGDRLRSFGDRPKRDFGDRPARPFGDRPARTRDKPRSFGDRSARTGDRSQRTGDRPRSFGDRPKRDFGDRPARPFGDRPARTGDKPVRAKPYRPGGEDPKKSFSNRVKSAPRKTLKLK